ncbi:hypothetical protein [Flavobacterium amniphilum]|nr:hypothetical protein [Flavobacterium amniphilum]
MSLQDLNKEEMLQVNGGGIVPLMIAAYAWGVAYGYLTEKYN